MSNHTPGPWEPNGRWTPQHCAAVITAPMRGFQGGSPAPLTIAYVGPNIQSKTPEHRSQMEANSRLIAAAPELLEALKVASVWAPHNHEPNADSNGHCPMCNAQSAIRKAEGIEVSKS